MPWVVKAIVWFGIAWAAIDLALFMLGVRLT